MNQQHKLIFPLPKITVPVSHLNEFCFFFLYHWSVQPKFNNSHRSLNYVLSTSLIDYLIHIHRFKKGNVLFSSRDRFKNPNQFAANRKLLLIITWRHSRSNSYTYPLCSKYIVVWNSYMHVGAVYGWGIVRNDEDQ